MSSSTIIDYRKMIPFKAFSELHKSEKLSVVACVTRIHGISTTNFYVGLSASLKEDRQIFLHSGAVPHWGIKEGDSFPVPGGES